MSVPAATQLGPCFRCRRRGITLVVPLTAAGDEHFVYHPNRVLRGKVMARVVEPSYVLDFEEKIRGEWVESPRYEGGFDSTLRGTEDEFRAVGIRVCLRLLR